QRGLAIAGVGQFANGQRAGVGHAVERSDEQRDRLLAAPGPPLVAERVEERLQRCLVLTGLDAAGAELVVAPPQAAIDLLAPRGRQRLRVERVEQRLRALQRGQRVALARVLHAANRLRGELTDLAAER